MYSARTMFCLLVSWCLFLACCPSAPEQTSVKTPTSKVGYIPSVDLDQKILASPAPQAAPTPENVSPPTPPPEKMAAPEPTTDHGEYVKLPSADEELTASPAPEAGPIVESNDNGAFIITPTGEELPMILEGGKIFTVVDGVKTIVRFNWTVAEIGQLLDANEDIRQSIMDDLTSVGYSYADFAGLDLIRQSSYDYWTIRTQHAGSDLPLPEEKFLIMWQTMEDLNHGLSLTYNLIERVAREHPADLSAEFRRRSNDYWLAFRMLYAETLEFWQASLEYGVLWQAKEFLAATGRNPTPEQKANLRRAIESWRNPVPNTSNHEEVIKILDEALRRLDQ